MKVFWKDPARLLQMEAESADDLNTLAGLLHGGPIKNAEWLKCPEDELAFACERGDGITTFMGGCAKVVGCVWDVASHIQHESEAQAGSQAIRALRQMLGLGLGDPADDLATWATRFTGYVQAHKQLTASLVHINAVLQTLGMEVANQKTMINTLMRAHEDAPLVVENPIVKVPDITAISDRERALLSALAAIICEAADYPDKKPQSSDSYLPDEFILAGVEALSLYLPSFSGSAGVPA